MQFTPEAWPTYEDFSKPDTVPTTVAIDVSGVDDGVPFLKKGGKHHRRHVARIVM